jgi:uncharacterized repeat protein (TIGR03803 family)
MAGLTLGDNGTLYGTTGSGGKSGGGVVFSLTPSDHDGWSERVLYHFKREVGEGTTPNSRLVFGKIRRRKVIPKAPFWPDSSVVSHDGHGSYLRHELSNSVVWPRPSAHDCRPSIAGRWS